MLSVTDDGGVETAEEATEPAGPDINELCRDMFDKMAVFLQGELTGNDNKRKPIHIFLIIYYLFQLIDF